MIHMLEVMRRCKHCKREMRVSLREYDENPFCQECLPERLEKSSAGLAPRRWQGDCGYLTLVPIERKGNQGPAKR